MLLRSASSPIRRGWSRARWPCGSTLLLSGSRQTFHHLRVHTGERHHNHHHNHHHYHGLAFSLYVSALLLFYISPRLSTPLEPQSQLLQSSLRTIMSDPNNPNIDKRSTPQYSLYQRENFWKPNTGEVPPFNTGQCSSSSSLLRGN